MSTELSTRPSGGLTSWFSRDPFRTLRDEMDSMLSRYATDWEGGWLAGERVPSIDLSESDESLEVKMDLPGIKPEEIDIEVTGDTLRIRGERKEEKEEKGKTYHRIERRSGSFSRSLRLPCTVKEDKVAAEYHDGVLSIMLPKTKEAMTHKVKVKPA